MSRAGGSGEEGGSLCANAEGLGTKLRLSVAINRILEERGVTQAESAKVLGVNQPKISALQHYKLEGFSVERLMHFVTALENDVVIEIRPRTAAKGRILIVQAKEKAVSGGRRQRVDLGGNRAVMGGSA